MLVVVRNRQSVVLSPTSGPVAQLGARFHGMEEVVGSIPTRSTNSYPYLTYHNLWPDFDLGPIGHRFPDLVDFLIRYSDAAVRPVPQPVRGTNGTIAVG